MASCSVAGPWVNTYVEFLLVSSQFSTVLLPPYSSMCTWKLLSRSLFHDCVLGRPHSLWPWSVHWRLSNKSPFNIKAWTLVTVFQHPELSIYGLDTFISTVRIFWNSEIILARNIFPDVSYRFHYKLNASCQGRNLSQLLPDHDCSLVNMHSVSCITYCCLTTAGLDLLNNNTSTHFTIYKSSNPKPKKTKAKWALTTDHIY